ncbi:hypothetical protein LEMLEM_LOCUS16134 [Lemmus lemmus]
MSTLRGRNGPNQPEESALASPPWSISLASSCGCPPERPGAQPPPPTRAPNQSRLPIFRERRSAGSRSPTCADLQARSRGSRTGGAETIQASVENQEAHLPAVYLWSKYVITQAQAGRAQANWSARKKRKRWKARKHDDSCGICFVCKS